MVLLDPNVTYEYKAANGTTYNYRFSGVIVRNQDRENIGYAMAWKKGTKKDDYFTVDLSTANSDLAMCQMEVERRIDFHNQMA